MDKKSDSKTRTQSSPQARERAGKVSVVLTNENGASTAEPAEDLTYQFTSELFVWSGGQTNWYFIRMPVAQSKELREQMDGFTNGFGSIRVKATIEESTWFTSVFPESATGSYLLPVKKQIRKAAEIEDGDTVRVLLAIVQHSSELPLPVTSKTVG